MFNSLLLSGILLVSTNTNNDIFRQNIDILECEQEVTLQNQSVAKVICIKEIQKEDKEKYKIVYKITTSETREGINKGLNGIAHAINMLGCVNIQNDKVKIAATIQGQATTIILNDNAYRKKFGKDNPNTEVIRLLSDYGVDLYVCSQATAYKKINKSDINKNITEALSGSSVLLNYQLNGYALMQ